MNLDLMTATVAANSGVLVCLLALGLSRAAGWQHLRSYALVAILAAGFTGSNVGVHLLPTPAAVWAARVQLSFLSLHALAWFIYLARCEGRRLLPWERQFAVLLVVGAVLPLLGELMLLDQIRTHRVEWLGVTYVSNVPSHFGEVFYSVYAVGHVIPFARLVRSWRLGARNAGTQVLGMSLALAMGINDLLVNLELYAGPYLLDFGFLGLVLTSGISLARDFVRASNQLEHLSNSLEHQVRERTLELSKANQALVRSEKLAAIGQLAAGVAHEINNPAAVVKANLGYLHEEYCREGAAPEDTRECLTDSLSAVDRIARIVRQMLDAGRVAAAKEGGAVPVDLAAVARVALTHAAAHLSDRVRVEVDITPELCALGQTGLLEQVASNLVVNAAQAIREAGRAGLIRVTARRLGDLVEMTVSDDGPGIPLEARGRVFEPFFTTRPIGQGTGLGLAVSLGLMRAQGGTLELVKSSNDGTTMRLSLPWSATVAQLAREAKQSPNASMRVLMIDDEVLLRQAFVRLLSNQYKVQCADGIDSALKLIDASPGGFDAVVCDLVMPNGGGQRLLGELTVREPALAARTLILTGGAVSEDQQHFLESLEERVMFKPLDVGVLRARLEKLTRRPATPLA